eukprot:15072489-Alexandrium_andersonii.AAC.1
MPTPSKSERSATRRSGESEAGGGVAPTQASGREGGTWLTRKASIPPPPSRTISSRRHVSIASADSSRENPCRVHSS